MLSILIPQSNEPNIDLFVRQIEKVLPVGEIIVACDRERKGKGWALREAFQQAKGDVIAFLDGDNEIFPRMLFRLLPFLEDFDVVVGSKRITHAPMRRKVMTQVTRAMFRFFFGVQVDTQTGIKLFRRSALESLSYWQSNGFVFDLEIITRLQKQGFKIVEVPIECEIKRQLAFKTIFRIAGEAIWLWFRLLFRQRQ